MKRDLNNFLKYINFVITRYDSMIRDHVSNLTSPYYINYDRNGECVRDDNKKYEELVHKRSIDYIKSYNQFIADRFFKEWSMSLKEFETCYNYRVKAFIKECDSEIRDNIVKIIKSKYEYEKNDGPKFFYDTKNKLWSLDTKPYSIKFNAKTLENLEEYIIRAKEML